MLHDMSTPCPKCGRMISTKLSSCPGCGERLESDREPVETEAVREVDFRAPLNLLGTLWIGWSLIGGCGGSLQLPELAGGYLPGAGPAAIVMLAIGSLTWFVSGLAALQKEMWGVYLGYVFSYLLLLASLIYFHPLGLFVSVCFILLSRYVLKQYRMLKEPAESSGND